MKITLISPTGQEKHVPTGFSISVFFLSFLVPLYRHDYKWAGVMLLSALILQAFVFYGFGNSYGALSTGIFYSITYNQIYLRGLLHNGWKAKNDKDKQRLNTII